MIATAEIKVEFFNGEDSLGIHEISDFGEIETIVEDKGYDYTHFEYTSNSSMEENKTDDDGGSRTMKQSQTTFILETRKGFEDILVQMKKGEDVPDEMDVVEEGPAKTLKNKKA